MELSKIKLGKRVTYKSRVRSGRGKIVEVKREANGYWVVVEDFASKVRVKTRPSQITT